MLQWLGAMLIAVTWVIPPGQEARLQQLLTPGPQWPAGWQLVSAQVQQDVVVASYQRGQEPPLRVKLQHPQGAAQGALRGPHVAIDAAALPAELRAALQAHVAPQAGAWLWQAAAQAAPVAAPQPATATAAAAPVGDDPADQLAAMRQALAQSEALPALARAQAQLSIAWHLRQLGDAQAAALFQRHLDLPGQSAEAALLRWSARLGHGGKPQALPADLELAVTVANLERQADRLDAALQRLLALDLARLPPGSPLVLPMTRVLIDAVGAQLPAALAYTQKIARQSDEHPDDSVAAFIAGTILHHSGDWQASNRYLQRSEKAFASEPRQFLYSAMNHLHLGEQAEAERRVTHAFRMGTLDPDVWYCRAMIFARSQPRQSLADLGNYLAAVKGTADNPARKSAYVAKVMADLEACSDAGNVGRCLDLRRGRAWLADQASSAAAALGLLALGAWLWRRRSARRTGAAALLLLALTAAAAFPQAGLAQSVLTSSAAAPSGPAQGTLSQPDVRELAAPQTLEAQLSWHTPNELLQTGLSVALIAGGAVFFCPPRASPSEP